MGYAMNNLYASTPVRAPRTHSLKVLLVFVLLLTVIELTVTLFLTIPCLRSLYARQNNVDYKTTLLETEITTLNQQNATLEKELHLLKQDCLILNNIDQERDFVAPKE